MENKIKGTKSKMENKTKGTKRSASSVHFTPIPKIARKENPVHSTSFIQGKLLIVCSSCCQW